MVDPTQFERIEVRYASRHPMGTEYGPFRVVGITNGGDSFFEGDGDSETVLYGDIPTKQIANKVLDVYLTEYVKDKYFSGYIDC
ncbi:hypothetical protein SEA_SPARKLEGODDESS_247 [Streptomyces phage SparkleGoddess]|uniref:Uncharacterized protein n=2 Tax=Gilsonvirus comrade TaxID=2846395 RepID=A0A345MEE5_9CAUD|nr:hypothetical protein SEA_SPARKLEGODDESS_247 [Streptomyces phage SparkleGoddess]QQO39900.1 hypothetical protein SEA_BELFORT_248 [Streptomyces phage Belfort]QZE11812.1 hypothetical protein SEA_KARP_247 [Streptomyces phage Karp]UTN92469.1 hypothetical protein SEA_STIGMA_245 [Streptomyces phage Stigma]